MNNEIVIVTPTYNRAELLKKLYASLRKQKYKKFEWVIIDDGSIDNTEKVCKEMQEAESFFKIKYYKQSNGGKARALNYAFDHVAADLYLVVDSDDILLPTALSDVYSTYKKYGYNNTIGGFFFHYQKESGAILGKEQESDEIANFYDKINRYDTYDGAIAVTARGIKKCRFPEYPGEKYVGPAVLLHRIANTYNMVFSKKIIGISEYQPGGLSASGRKLRLKNPRGMMEHSRPLMNKRMNWKIRIKYSLLFCTFGLIGKYRFSQLVKESKHPWLVAITIIPSIFLKRYWIKKYEK